MVTYFTLSSVFSNKWIQNGFSRNKLHGRRLCQLMESPSIMIGMTMSQNHFVYETKRNSFLYQGSWGIWRGVNEDTPPINPK